ncbi:unnamed protein product [Gadus morhua 'NCC']
MRAAFQVWRGEPSETQIVPDVSSGEHNVLRNETRRGREGGEDGDSMTSTVPGPAHTLHAEWTTESQAQSQGCRVVGFLLT